MNGMHTSAVGLDLIRGFESFSAEVYRCPAGRLTIGYGHVVLKTDRIAPPITEAFAEQLLTADLSWVEEDLNALAVPLAQHQFDALASLVFNIGRGAFAGSTLRRRLLAGDMERAANQFPRWVFANGKVLPGLTRRRAAEAALFRGETIGGN